MMSQRMEEGNVCLLGVPEQTVEHQGPVLPFTALLYMINDNKASLTDLEE